MTTKKPAAHAPQMIAADIDAEHPAIDGDPRAGTSDEQNRIDLNDPTISGQQAVALNLGIDQ